MEHIIHNVGKWSWHAFKCKYSCSFSFSSFLASWLRSIFVGTFLSLKTDFVNVYLYLEICRFEIAGTSD